MPASDSLPPTPAGFSETREYAPAPHANDTVTLAALGRAGHRAAVPALAGGDRCRVVVWEDGSDQ